MATPFLSEIKLVSFNFAPKGWALCNGQTLPINQNQALFSLLGTTYGGNGTTTFQLPNLQGNVPVHMGPDTFGNQYELGQAGGQANVSLEGPEMPEHAHQAQAVAAAASSASPAGNFCAQSATDPYGSSANAAMSVSGVSEEGGGQPHNNMPPYLVLNFVIALAGIFPSRN
jgi:microcystin-dependent protein